MKSIKQIKNMKRKIRNNELKQQSRKEKVKNALRQRSKLLNKMKNTKSLISNDFYILYTDGLESANMYRLDTIHYLLNSEPAGANSRMILNEYKKEQIFVHGIIADVKPIFDEEGNVINARILIDKPNFTSVNGSTLSKGRKHDLSSHIWMLASDIDYYDDDVLTISIGDRIQLISHVKQYYGYGEYGKKMTKFGLRNIAIIGLGVPVKFPDGNTKVVNNYPRNGDWVLKLSGFNQIDKMIDSNKSDNVEKIDSVDIAIEYKKSIWPSYEERFGNKKITEKNKAFAK